MNNVYPKVMVENKNIYYAHLLLEDYSGENGELTAITQYIYQNFNIFKEYPYLAHILSKIARTEMMHLELLGKTIKLLGLEPKFITNNKYLKKYNYWNSSYINYENNIINILQANILSEKIAIKNYRNHISLIKDKYIRNLLYRIIEDENKHLNCFKILLINFLNYN